MRPGLDILDLRGSTRRESSKLEFEQWRHGLRGGSSEICLGMGLGLVALGSTCWDHHVST